MFATLKTEWPFFNGADLKTRERVVISPGRYEIEPAENPFIEGGKPWYVFKGTLVGATAGWWRDWADPMWEEMQIVIEE